MKRLLPILLGMLIALPTLLWAEPIDKNQALEKAQQFYNSRSQTLKAGRLRRVPRATNVNMELENDCFYVFTAGEDDGFVIISGDDRTMPVLGYADSGTFSPDDMPENMKAWLDEYASQIRYLQQGGNESSSSIDNPPSHPKIAPMIYTKWYQRAPYNAECPVFFDESKYGRTLTGCLPTAVAQILKYHMHPARTTQTIPGYTCGTDHHEFLGKEDAQYIKVPAIPIMTFDWDNMLNSYDDKKSQTEINAVASLMQAVGTSVKTDYDINGSSANARNIKYALVNYFDYDKSMRLVLRADYTASAWDELIYTELANHRPVCFSGKSTSAGHCFVLDGFDGDGYYHVNWGWSGEGDGYYLLGILNAYDESGKGFGSHSYNSYQTALIGIKPNMGGKDPDNEPMTTDTISITGNTTFTRSSSDKDFTNVSVAASFWNFNGFKATFDLGYGVYDIDDNLKDNIYIKKKETFEHNYGFSIDQNSKSFNFGANMGNGKYRIVPISKLSDLDQWHQNKNTETYYILATINNNSLKLSYPYEEMVASFSLLNSPEANGPADLKISLKNNGLDYKGTLIVHAALKENGSRNYSNTIRNAMSPAPGTFDEEASDNMELPKESNKLYQYNLDIRGGESQTRTVSVSFAQAGTYDVYLTTDYYKPLSRMTIQVTETKTQELNCQYDVTNGDKNTLEILSNRMEVDITYENIGSNNYDNIVYVDLYKKNNNNGEYRLVTSKIDRLTLNAGAQQKRSYVFQDLENGGMYYVRMCYCKIVTDPNKPDNPQFMLYYVDNKSPVFTVNYYNPEAYAVLSNGTLTFYYDDRRSSRQGKTYSMNTGYVFPEWTSDSLKIRKAVFDGTFVDYRPTTTAHWFEHEVNLTSIEGLTNLNTSSTTNMQSMFYECYALPRINVSKFATHNVTDMGWMFYECNALKSLNLKNFNTSKVTNMNSMFCYCSSLNSIDVSKFDTRNVTDMAWMFYGCTSLTQANVSSFNTQNVTSMKGMFYNCENLTTLDVSSFSSFKLQDMSFMFRGCSKLKELDLSGFKTSNVEVMNVMFWGCSSLTKIYASNSWNTAKVTNSEIMFKNCNNLVGGKGTKYNPDHVDKTYARLDGGTSRPGYFTYKAPSLKGDVNSDGSVDVADIGTIIDAMAGSANVLLARADVNGDGTIDVADIAAVIDIMAANARQLRETVK